MRTYRSKALKSGFIAVLICLLSSLQQLSAEEALSGREEYFVGYTPLSPTVWNSFAEEPVQESDLRDYLFREAYVVEADRTLFQTKGRSFLVPVDDLASTQRRLLSPYAREEEEKTRRDYAESVSSIVLNKGVPEYLLQLLGLQKLKEGVRKIEKATALDFALSKPAPNVRNARPWRFKTAFLLFQKSYKVGFSNGIWNWETQGGYTSNKGNMLFTTLSARWSRFVQANTYQLLTNTAYTSLSVFVKRDLSVSYTFRKEFVDDPKTVGTSLNSVGVNYIF